MAAYHHASRTPNDTTASVSGSRSTTLASWAGRYRRVHVDLGTGDGTFAVHLARTQPDTAVIGLDINLDRIRLSAKRRPANLRFVADDALGWRPGSLPAADAVTIAFPFGSILRGLVDGDERLVDRLDALLLPASRIEVRVNASALLAASFDPESAVVGIAATLNRVPGLGIRTDRLDAADLRRFPSRWSKRLGYGRPADAWLIAGARHSLAAHPKWPGGQRNAEGTVARPGTTKWEKLPRGCSAPESDR